MPSGDDNIYLKEVEMITERGQKLNLTATQMEDLIEKLNWFWGSLYQQWRFATEEVCGLATTEKIEKIFASDIGRSQAKSLKKILNIGSGIAGLMEAFRFVPENFLEPFEITERSESHVVIKNPSCTVQKARLKKGLKEYPCKDVATLYFAAFAREIDPAIHLDCLVCPPDDSHKATCQWRFTISERA